MIEGELGIAGEKLLSAATCPVRALMTRIIAEGEPVHCAKMVNKCGSPKYAKRDRTFHVNFEVFMNLKNF